MRYRRSLLSLKISQFGIWVFLDNSTAVAYTNHGGDSRFQTLINVSAQLTTWWENHGISLEAVHVAGKLNIFADEESRDRPDAGDLKLDPCVFKHIQELSRQPWTLLQHLGTRSFHLLCHGIRSLARWQQTPFQSTRRDCLFTVFRHSP